MIFRHLVQKFVLVSNSLEIAPIATCRFGDSQLHSLVTMSEVVNANFEVRIVETCIAPVQYDSSAPAIEIFERAGLCVA